MNELEAIVQRMIDAGESESNIAAVIQEYSKREEAGKIQPQVTGAPVEETAAPDMVSNLEPPSLDLQEQKTAEQKEVVKGFLRTAASGAPFGANLLAETDFTRSLASFALRTTAGVVDAFERTILPAAEGATNPIRLAAYLSAEKEERDMMIKEAGTGVDMSPITELADFIDSAKPVYTDEEGNQLRATDLMQRGEFGRAVEVMAGELTSAAPSLAVSYLMPGIGSAILGISTYGNEFENALKNRPEETAEKLYTASGLKGLSEWGFEYIGGKAFRALSGLKNANAPAESLKDYASKYLNQVMLTFGANFAQEGLTEAATTVAQEYTDQLVYGDEKNLKEVSKQAFNDFLIGGLLGGPVAGVTRGIQLKQTKENKEEVYLYAAPKTKQEEILQARERAAKATEDFNNAPEPLKTQYKEYKDEADKTKKDLENRLYERFDNLDRSELINYANNLKIGVAQQRIAQSSQDPEIKQKAREKARKAYEENEKLIGDLNFYDAKLEEALGLRKARLEEQQKQLRKTTGLQKDDLKIKKLSAAEFEKIQTPEGLANKGASGMFLDADGTIYLNKDVIPTIKDTNVLGHELLHYIMSRQFKVDDASMEPLITSFKDYLKENQPEALKRIEDRLEGAYKGNAPLEEYLNVFSDLVKNKGIASLKGIDKIKNEVNNTLQLLGFQSARLDTGEDVFNFIRNYTKNVNSDNMFIAKRALEVKLRSDVLKQTAQTESVKYSLTEEENNKLKEVFSERKEKILSNSIASKVIQKVAKAITKKYYDPIAADAKRGVTRDEYEISAISDLSLIALEWDPAKQDFGKFLANRGFLRLSNLATRLGIESTEAFGGVGIMENVETSKEVQEETEEQVIEITPIEDKVERPTLLESLDLGLKIENKEYKEYLNGVLTKAVKLGVSKYNEEISANRTVTPFVGFIKQYISEELRKTTKQFINAYPGGYESFLKDNKKVILLNFTTTYLSKHPLFRKGIEKSIGGTMGTDNTGKKVFEPNWTLPQEVTKNKFDWVDAKGNKAKIDRDNAGVRGLTSGPEIMRRSPKINSVITDNEFIDYHFQDGALRKKKKQNPEDALAMQLASELGFELLKNDFSSNGPLSEQFGEIAELKGQVVGQIELEQIAKDMDRGTVKYSIAPAHIEIIVENNLYGDLFDAWKAGELKERLQETLSIPEPLAANYAEAFSDLLEKRLVNVYEDLPEKDIKNIGEKIINNSLYNSLSSIDGVFLLSRKFINFRNAKNKPSEEAKKFTKSFVDEASNAINNLETKEAKIEFIDNLIIYDAKTFTKGEAKNKYLTTNSELFNSIISPLIKAGKIADMYKAPVGNGPIRKKYSDGKFRRINRPSEYDLSSTTLQLKIANDPVKFNSFALQAKSHLLNVWDFIKKSNNIELANAYLTLSLASESSALRTAAWLKYSDKNAEQKQNALNEKIAKEGRLKTKKDEVLRWEHMTPSSHVARAMISNFINENFVSNEELNNILDNYYAAIIDINLDKKITSNGLSRWMGRAYNEFGLTPEETRYKEALGNDWKIDDYNQFNSAGVKVRYSLAEADIDRMNAMISETGKVSVNEISEVTATRLGATKGKFRFFIPPSADDFVGLMYYTLREGKQGDEDLQFIKEKLLDPFTKGQAAFDSYKLSTLNQFRAFKKYIRKVTKAKLSSKNDLGFTNEEAVRVYIWDKKGVDIPGISKTEISNLVKLVNGNKDLLAFANNITTLLSAQGGYPDPQQNWFGGSITIDVLEHINEISRKEFFAEFREATDQLFGKLNNRGEISGPIANKLRAAYGDNYVEALSDVLYRMQNGRGREFGKNKLMNQFNNWINNSVGAVMFLNARSALLQQVSLVNFINLTDNNPIKFAAAIANPKQYWADYLELINSDYLVQRRSGIKIDVNQDELVKAAESGRNPVQSVISLILKKGFVLTTWGDSNAIATGGAAFYRNRINTYLNNGLSETEAKEKAFNDFRELAEESQQSSRPDRISQQQASTLGRIILAWANTPMQYARITKKAALDLINNRGDWKTNMSKLIYYGAVQNLMFSYLQAGLFSMIFDGEDDEEEDMKKYAFTFNSMADGFLRGLGFGGAIAATTKNMVLEAIDQAKGRGNYDEVVWEALKLSPPLGSKISKARAVGRTFGWKQEREKVFTEGFSLDNPAFEAVGKAVSATTNIPLDRVVRKLDNITYPMRHDVEFWQAAALYLGWGQWELGLKDVEKRKKEKEKLKIKDKKYIL